jgi:hypothetical protein
MTLDTPNRINRSSPAMSAHVMADSAKWCGHDGSRENSLFAGVMGVDNNRALLRVGFLGSGSATGYHGTMKK